MREWWRLAVEFVAWGAALAWCWRTSDLVRLLPTVPDITGIEWDVKAGGLPSLTVVVPARNEEGKLAATLDALMLTDLPGLKVLVVDDRSEDRTGLIMDAYAVEYAGRVEVLHIRELPEGWLGKTHAMERALERCATEYVLFTDADVLFSPSVLRRAVVFARASQADHLVVMPTMQISHWSEGVVLSFFQLLGMGAVRLWRVADPAAKRDAMGIGAFNMVRRAALAEIGGWGPQRMVVLEDVTLGRRMKAAGMQQRVVFAPGLVLVHWARGARGLVGVMTKNLFSAFNFRPELLLAACVGLVAFAVLPLWGLFYRVSVVPCALLLLCVAATYVAMRRASRLPARYGWTYPLGAAVFVWAMLRSMVTAWRNGGVEWRGTLYPLRELREHNSPLRWERAAGKGEAL
jgi:cellulose synthase/poly-beta-1,6-N-acetylglucosamine synthase-like glycosyltransferase